MNQQRAERRAFLGRLTQAAAVATCGGLVWNGVLMPQAHAVPFALRPPGARDEAAFNATCIKCGLCVEACPYGTLRLARVGEPVPIGTPHFLPRDVPCYMCPDVPCAKVCPTGALDRSLDDIARARMGVAVVDAEHCLSWQGLRCEVCYRVCPVQGKAISVEPHPRGLSKHAVFVPTVHSAACTGCGICEKACPTELASVRVLLAKLVQGRIGEHYRLGWKDDAGPGEGTARPSLDVPGSGFGAPSGDVASPARAAGADYLNRGGPP